MDYDTMMDMTNGALVEEHNKLAEALGANTLSGWKQAKAKLVERIEGLQAQIADAEIDDEDDADDELTSVTVNSETFEQVDEPITEAPGEPIPDEPKRTIKSTSVDLLCHVAFYENRTEKSSDENRVEADNTEARSVGLAYDEIIRRIQEEFPGCKTSVACLRWYSVKIRVEEHGYEDLRLPQRRPRAKPKTSN